MTMRRKRKENLLLGEYNCCMMTTLSVVVCCCVWFLFPENTHFVSTFVVTRNPSRYIPSYVVGSIQLTDDPCIDNNRWASSCHQSKQREAIPFRKCSLNHNFLNIKKGMLSSSSRSSSSLFSFSSSSSKDWTTTTTPESKLQQQASSYQYSHTENEPQRNVQNNYSNSNKNGKGSKASSSSSSKRNQLRWNAQSVEKILFNDMKSMTSNLMEYTNSCEILINGFVQLSVANHPTQIVNAGRQLETLLRNRFLFDEVSVQVQERVVKVASIVGLVQPLAINIMNHMILQRSYIPSEMCQDSFFLCLRQLGRINQMEQTLMHLGKLATASTNKESVQFVVRQQSTTNNDHDNLSTNGISLYSFNIYLACLCDLVTKSGMEPGKIIDNSDGIDRAWKWMQSIDIDYNNESNRSVNQSTTSGSRINSISLAQQTFGIIPDAVSYATVIQAASFMKNETLVNWIWEELNTRKITPNIVAYNAKMRLLSTTTKKNSIHVQQNDQEILKIWNHMVYECKMTPDKYSIDLILLPLIRAGRMGDVEVLLDDFIRRNREKVVTDAFAAFLVTIVNGDELSSARDLFETYIQPSLLPPVLGQKTMGSIRAVKPTIRHFNILLEGCRRAPSVDVDDHDSDNSFSDDNQIISSRSEEGWRLYDLIHQSEIIQPDAYTITSMMGLCRNSSELSNLINVTLDEYKIEIRSVVLRAALTAYGELRDPSSALWIFVHFVSKSTRSWNVFFGALAKSSAQFGTTVLDMNSSQAAKQIQSNLQVKNSLQPIASLLNKVTVLNATQLLLEYMTRTNETNYSDAPYPNSQTFCIVASAMQYSVTGSSKALDLFRTAKRQKIPADGRFINAIFRCYGDDIDAALNDWKNEIRQQLVVTNGDKMSISYNNRRTRDENLVAAYSGLLYVCGRARRPDIAVRLVYAMVKDGLEPNEVLFNSYKSGKRIRTKDESRASLLVQKLQLASAYESVLEVECMKYDKNDIRRQGEKRVRIVL